jgi:hypothetical protein
MIFITRLSAGSKVTIGKTHTYILTHGHEDTINLSFLQVLMESEVQTRVEY